MNVKANYGELQPVIEESTSGEEEQEGRRNESPPRGMDNVCFFFSFYLLEYLQSILVENFQ